MSILLRKHIEEIVHLTDEEFDHVRAYFTDKKLKRHQYVIQEGKLVDCEFFVLEGLLRSYFVNDEGREHTIQFAQEEWWISDYQALHHHENATLNIECLEASHLLSISLEHKNKLCADLHKMEHFFRIKTSTGYIALQKRILSLLNNDAKTRYLELLEKYPALFQRVPKSLIASYLGVSRETLSRLTTS